MTPSSRLPVVAIVGRPNVGKSTLFNRLTRTRRAIVDSVPGITRDRQEHSAEWIGRWFSLVDTGGLDLADPATIPRQIVEQALRAVAEADLVVFLVDVRAGLAPVEKDIADVLRRKARSVLVAANKSDGPRDAAGSGEFHALGLGPVIPVSAEQGVGVDDLLDAILQRLPDAPTEAVEDPAIRIAVVGRPNVGKSSLINRLLGDKRLLVSDVPGTTRDAVDVRLRAGDQDFVLVDTAGLRRKGTDKARLDHVSRVMAERAVERADVALLLLDAVEGPTHQDAVVAGLAVEKGAGLVVLLNKWDLVPEQEARYPKIVAEVREKLKFAPWAAILTISALTGERVHRILAEARRVAENRRRRIPTARLNQVVEEAMARHQPPQSGKGRSFRVKYLSQVSASPPTFVAFTTSSAPHFTWRRFLENRLREEFDFEGTPIVVHYRATGTRRRRAGGEEPAAEAPADAESSA